MKERKPRPLSRAELLACLRLAVDSGCQNGDAVIFQARKLEAYLLEPRPKEPRS